MSRSWDRRRFLTTTGRSLLALGLTPALATRRPAVGSLSSGAGPDGLPQRVVGLRTLGGDFRFDPVGLRVEAGDSVTWLNLGDFHTTSAFHPDNDRLLADRVPLRIPEGAEPWHSGMLGLSAETEFTYTFRVPGVYDYFCQPHYSFGMVGRVVAGEPGGGPAVSRPISELNEASRKQMPPVETVVGPVGRTFEWAARLNGLLLLEAADGDVLAAARSTASGMEADGRLQDVASAAGEGDRLSASVEEVVAGARDGVGYGELLDRIDAAKDVLAAVR